MNKVIHNLNSITGWVAGGTAVITGANSIDRYIAGDLAASLIFQFLAMDDSVTYTFGTPIDVTDYDIITLWTMSLLSPVGYYSKASDFKYKIAFGVGKEYYLEARELLCPVTIDISDLTSLEYIKITALTDDSDYLIASYCIASTDEFPLDIFDEIRTKLQAQIDSKYLTSYLIGTTTATVGAGSITLAADAVWAGSKTVVYVSGGGNTEKHQIDQQNGNELTFNANYDGPVLLHAYAGASVYVYFPVENVRVQNEILLPGINIWGLENRQIFENSVLDNFLDTFKTDDTFAERNEGQYIEHAMTLDIEARHDEHLAILSQEVRKFLGKRRLWVNGYKVLVTMESMMETPVTEAYITIPKTSYVCKVVVKEELYDRVSLPKTTDLNLTVEAVEQGTL